MKRITLIALALATVCAVSGVVTSSSLAARTCYRVLAPGAGSWQKPNCTEASSGHGEYVWVKKLTQQEVHNIWCAETTISGEGLWADSQCSVLGPPFNFIRVYGPPKWNVNGAQLKQGVKQIKLQLKGKAVLKSEVSNIKLTLECNTGAAEGAAIEGNGNGQGQDKGRITFEQCQLSEPTNCKVEEPIKTVQTKSYLATTSGRQQKIVDVFEPQQGTIFTELKFKTEGGCLIPKPDPVRGSVAAEVLPVEAEGQEGLLNFPATPITTILFEEQEKTIGLKLGSEEAGKPATFAAAFGTRLNEGGTFGTFGG
jgi:hypothetical protein